MTLSKRTEWYLGGFLRLCEADSHSAIVVMQDKNTGEVTVLCSMTNDPEAVKAIAKEALQTIAVAQAGRLEATIN